MQHIDFDPLVAESAPGADDDEARPLAIADAQAQRIARDAFVNAAEYAAWLGPLLEAIRLRADPGIVFGTQWGGSPSGREPTPDPAKHEAYVSYIRQSVNGVAPWLLPLLDAAGATVIVSPGVFCFAVMHRLGVAFDLPAELLPLTRVLPWVEPGEIAH
jgi:hypothetical protein